MNKNRHRIIFNAARGHRMVVAETAGSHGGAAAGEAAPGSTMVLFADAAIKRSLTALAVLLLCTPAHPQIVADPSAPGNQRPTVLQTANGLPQVDIQTPSAAGVSRNTYSRFDVQSFGAILNNSRSNVSTQLGGHIAANPWLATGEARVILNEVHSSHPSHLNGYVEVAGRRAEVIIANPAGIQVNGGGFINASGVTLTTGTPVMNSGHLDAFRVQGGTVNIEGLGLDTSTADHTTILTRAMQLNAGVWAKDLTVVTGTNEVKALASGASALSTRIAGNGDAPTFMLDVGALGGMYAGKIHLVGTEAGLGVNNRGSLIAHEGTWVLQTDGSLVNTGKVQAQGDLSVLTAGSVSNTGVDASISSEAHTSLSTGEALDNTDGEIASAGMLSVATLGPLTNLRGRLLAVGDSTIDTRGALLDNTAGRINSQATLTLKTGELLNGAQATQGGLIGSNGDLSIHAGVATNGADGATQSNIWSAQTARLSTQSFTNAGVLSGRHVALDATADATNAAGASITATDSIAIDAVTFNNRGSVYANETADPAAPSLVHIQATTLNNTGAGAIFGDQIAMAATTLNNRPEAGGTTAPVIAARQQLDMGVQTLNNEDGALIYSGANGIQKRLGDGFYEQRLVREQVGQLTGRRFLEGHASDEAQFQALMDAGITYAQAHQLIPGVALSAEQMAQLTTDLVWLVEREVVLPDGSKTTALVPQVYVRQVKEGDFAASGALLAGNTVSLQIAEDLVNAGGRIEGGVVVAQAGRDLSNIGGLMQARSELLASAGRNVTISSPTHTTSFNGRYVNQSRTELAGVGTMRVGNTAGAQLNIEAGGNVELQGASLSNAGVGGSTTIQAAGDVRLQTMTVGSTDNTEYNARNYQRSSQSREVGTSVQGAGSVNIQAGNDVTARAASVNAGDDLSVKAGNDITLEAGRAVSESESSLYVQRRGLLSKKSTEERRSSASDVALGSSFSGGNVVLEAGQDIAIKGSSVNAQDLLLLDAGRDVAITSEQNTESGSYFNESKKSGFSAGVMSGISYGKNHQNTSQAFSAQTQAGSSVGGADVTIQSGRDTVVRSSAVISDQDLTVVAGRDARIEAATDTLSSTNEAYSKSSSIGFVPGASGRFTAFGKTQSTQEGTSTSETAVQSLLSANAGSLTVIAGTDSQYQGTGSGNVDTQGGTLLAQDAVALSGNSVTLGTADSRSENEFHAQSKSFTIGSHVSTPVHGAIVHSTYWKVMRQTCG